MTYPPKFKFFHEGTQTMYEVYNICLCGAPTVTVAYNPVKKYRLDTGFLLPMTGLLDQTGKPIFVGDICRLEPYNKFYLSSEFIIDFDDGAYTNKHILRMTTKDGRILSKNECGYCYTSHITRDYARKFKVIGNIYENPELLKG